MRSVLSVRLVPGRAVCERNPENETKLSWLPDFFVSLALHQASSYLSCANGLMWYPSGVSVRRMVIIWPWTREGDGTAPDELWCMYLLQTSASTTRYLHSEQTLWYWTVKMELLWTRRCVCMCVCVCVVRPAPSHYMKDQGNVEYLNCSRCDYSHNPIRLQRSLAWTMNPINLMVQDGE